MTPTPKIERRKVPRQAAKVETTLVHEDGIVRKTGTIRNISPEGAKLSFASTEDIPDAAYILIPDRHQIEPYRVVWRSEDEVGLAFTAVESAKPGKP